MPSRDAQNRRRCILALLGQHEVRNQAELAELLADEGIEATQATLSRDLRELGVAKGPDGYTTNPTPTTESGLAGAVDQWLLGATPAMNQVVLQTPPGGAQPLGLALDRARLPSIVGTVAGDDTVLVICKTPRAASKLADELLTNEVAS